MACGGETERSGQDCNRYSGLLAGPLDLAGQVNVRVSEAQALSPAVREDVNDGGLVLSR
jgi:hypothetical protein